MSFDEPLETEPVTAADPDEEQLDDVPEGDTAEAETIAPTPIDEADEEDEDEA